MGVRRLSAPGPLPLKGEAATPPERRPSDVSDLRSPDALRTYSRCRPFMPAMPILTLTRSPKRRDKVAFSVRSRFSSCSRGLRQMDITKRVSVPSNVMFRSIRDEALLLNLDTEQYAGLDAAGVAFWSALTSASDIAGALSSLESAFDVEPAVLKADLAAFLAGLSDRGLVELVDA